MRALVILVAIAGLGFAAWWTLLRSEPERAIETDESAGPVVPPPAAVAMAESVPVPTEILPIDVAPEAVATPGERLPDRGTAGKPSVVPMKPERFASEPEISGAELLAAIVAAKVAPVRWDSETTRERFRRAKFPLPSPRMLEDKTVGPLLEDIATFVRGAGDFSSRLDRKALWIGKKGAYVE